MKVSSMRVCAAGLAIAVLSCAAPARAQVVTFTDIRDAVSGKGFDPNPANTHATPGDLNTLDIAFENNFKVTTGTPPLSPTPDRSLMDTISFNVNAPEGYYVSSIAYQQEGTGTISRAAQASGASNWVIGGQPADLGFFSRGPNLPPALPVLKGTVTFTDSRLSVVPVSITTGLFVFETLGEATVVLTSATVEVTVAPLSDDPKKTATIAVSPFTGTYDGESHRATGKATGVNGEDLSHLLDFGESFTNVPGGIARWTFRGDANYSAASGAAAIIINPADATVAVFGFTGPYDGAPHGATGTATGVNGEALFHLLNLGARFTNVPGGPADWTFNLTNPVDPNYNAATGTVAITISKATTILTWPPPAGITAGTALTATQLNATASVGGVNVDGVFVYEPPLGTVLTATQPLSVAFTPADTVNYTGAAATVTITVTANTGMRIINPGPQTNMVGDEVKLRLRVLRASRRSASDDGGRRRGEWTAAGLPPGLRMDEEGEIRGRVTTVGTYPVVVTFTRNGVTVSAQFDWTVLSRSAKGKKG